MKRRLHSKPDKLLWTNHVCTSAVKSTTEALQTIGELWHTICYNADTLLCIELVGERLFITKFSLGELHSWWDVRTLKEKSYDKSLLQPMRSSVQNISTHFIVSSLDTSTPCQQYGHWTYLKLPFVPILRSIPSQVHRYFTNLLEIPI